MTAYSKVHPEGWEDLPSTATPIDAAALDQMEEGIADAQDTADSAATAASSASSAVTAHLADGTDAHDASAISITPIDGVTGTDVQAALADIKSDITSAGSGYTPGGTDVAIEDGGTGASTAANARTNLGLAIGSDVQAFSSVLQNTTASFTTADETKLDGVEALADVTDATNVDAAGAVMNSDTSTAAMQFVIDEDNMGSNSATKVPTQQSVKEYVDTNTGSLASKVKIKVRRGGGDLSGLNSTSLAAIDATNLGYETLTLAVGDVVQCEFHAQGFAGGAVVLGLDFQIDRPVSADTTLSNGNDNGAKAEGLTTARSGIDCIGWFVATEAGTHGFRPAYKVNTGTATIANATSGTGESDITFKIQNLGAVPLA